MLRYSVLIPERRIHWGSPKVVVPVLGRRVATARVPFDGSGFTECRVVFVSVAPDFSLLPPFSVLLRCMFVCICGVFLCLKSFLNYCHGQGKISWIFPLKLELEIASTSNFLRTISHFVCIKGPLNLCKSLESGQWLFV